MEGVLRELQKESAALEEDRSAMLSLRSLAKGALLYQSVRYIEAALYQKCRDQILLSFQPEPKIHCTISACTSLIITVRCRYSFFLQLDV